MADVRDAGTDDADMPACAAAIELLIRFARVGHDAGYPTADFEERMLALAGASGLLWESERSALPSARYQKGLEHPDAFLLEVPAEVRGLGG